MRYERILYGLIILVFCFGLIGCDEEESGKKIDFSEKEKLTELPEKYDNNSIHFAIGSMVTPREGYIYYKQLLDYLETVIERPIEIVDRENYSEINALLESGGIDFAFVCGGPYVDGHEKFGLELLAAPKVFGKSVYYSYIIVSIDSEINTFSQLEGKTFAFTDPLSNTGKLVPTYMLSKMNKYPDTFFKKYSFTFAHDKSIIAVANKIVDGAAVDSLIWEYMNKSGSPFTKRTRMIEKSRPYGIPPVVVRKDVDKELKNKVRHALLNMHKVSKGKEILKHMMIDEFTDVDDSDYDSIREISKWISESSTNKE